MYLQKFYFEKYVFLIHAACNASGRRGGAACGGLIKGNLAGDSLRGEILHRDR